MRFGVLGPLAVWTVNGEPVAIREAKVRALLADLLIHAGRAVPADQLIEDLWGDQLPANPANTLQAKVSLLRRALEEAEPGGRGLVAYLPPGYVLRIEADAVDAGRFTTLIAQARQIDGSRAKAAVLGHALALWRGSAYADFGNDKFAWSEITRLEEQRLAAVEDHTEARLELGEHRQLAGELSDLVARHPLRERLRATQMRALYRAGRQTEALASYADLHDHLANELGLDPSPELVNLHQAILRQDPALDAVPVPAVPATRPRTNLPAPLTDLIGRGEAIAEVRALLEAGRLVTLTGPGGVGKTRLATETATQLLDTFPDGVWLVDLAALDRASGPDAVPAAAEVAEVLGASMDIREGPVAGVQHRGRPAELTDWLSGALRHKRTLLVLDNCEHVVEPVALLVERLLRTAPELRILTTSREPLTLAGELLWMVPPLELPDEGAGAEPGALAAFSAVRLFVARAAAASPGFALDSGNARAVAEICRRLDGIPLALELAATRVRALGVHELATGLDERFRLLSTGHRGAPTRQQTLQAVIDWSWQLLTDRERIVARRLAIHAGSTTLDAAEAVCTGGGVAAVDVLELLARLVDRSLVTAIGSTHGTRYQMLESVTAYCLERLREAGEFQDARHRHARYYLDLAERAAPQLRGHDQRQWLDRLDAETANLRSILDYAVRHHDPDLALRLVNALAWYWYLRGRLREASRSLITALAIPGCGAPTAARATAMAWRAGLALVTREGTDQVTQTRSALDMYDQIDDPAGQARAEWFLGANQYGGGDLSTGEELLDRALTGFRRLEDRWGVAAALSARATHALVRSDLITVKGDGEQSLALFRELGDRWGQLQATFALGSLAEITGDYAQAARVHRDGLHLAEELGLWTDVSYRLSGLGRIALLTGDYASAAEYHERARQLAAEQGYQPGERFAQVGLGLGARRQGRLELAETHMRNLLEWNRRTGYAPGIAQTLAELGFIAEQRGDADAALSLHLDGLAAARDTGDRRAVALALEGLAGAHALAGRHDHAAQLLGAAAAARESVGVPLPPAERGDVDRITAQAREALGEDTFATEFDRGRHVRPDDGPSVQYGEERWPGPDHVDSIADLYLPGAGQASDPLLSALEIWDHEEYRPLELTDPDLYRLICVQIGFEADILLGNGTVKLGQRGRFIELTWNGDDEDLVDLVLQSANLIADP